MSDKKDNDLSSPGKEENQSKTVAKRRKFLAGSITTGATVAGLSSGGKWVKPVVDSVVLPAHAQATGPVEDSAPQPSGALRIQGLVDGNEFDGYPSTYNDGNYPITSDGSPNYNNFSAKFAALFQPIQDQTLSVTLDVNAIQSGPGTLSSSGLVLSQTTDVPPADVPVNLGDVDLDMDGATADTSVTVVGTLKSAGFATRRITYVVTG